MDDEYEDEEEQWEDGAEDILEKGEKLVRTVDANVDKKCMPLDWKYDSFVFEYITAHCCMQLGAKKSSVFSSSAYNV